MLSDIGLDVIVFLHSFTDCSIKSLLIFAQWGTKESKKILTLQEIKCGVVTVSPGKPFKEQPRGFSQLQLKTGVVRRLADSMRSHCPIFLLLLLAQLPQFPVHTTGAPYNACRCGWEFSLGVGRGRS